MTVRKHKSLKAIAVFVAFAVAQVSLQLSFAAPASTAAPVLLQQQLVATLTVTGGSALVNGTSASSGASVVTGAEIEAPPGVRVTIDLGALGRIDMKEGSRIRLYFECDENAPPDANQKKCRLRVVLLAGCVAIAAGKDTRAQVDTAAQQNVMNTDEEDKDKKRRGGAPLLSPCVGPDGLLLTALPTAAGLLPGTIALIAVAATLPPALWWAFSGGGANPSPAIP